MSQVNALTLFNQTERGNYVSRGSQGITFVAREDRGWVTGQSEDEGKYNVAADSQAYATHIEALRSVSSPNGFIIDPSDNSERQLYPTREVL